MERYFIPKKLAFAFAFVLLSVITLHGAGIVSADNVGNVLPFFCPFKILTGIPCPGCGMTRAILSITKGDFREALNYNPFSFFLLFAVVVSIIPGKYMEKLLSGKDVAVNCFLITVLVSVIVFWFFTRLLPAL
jgi:glucan phosphoethanolaminetransferase (alkaline phosphatase superfamily)